MSIVNDFIDIFDPDFTDTDSLKDTLTLLGAFALGHNSASHRIKVTQEIVEDKVNDLFMEYVEDKYNIFVMRSSSEE